MSPPQSKFQLKRTPVKKITNVMLCIINVLYVCYCCILYRISRNTDSDFNLANRIKITKLTYTFIDLSMGFSPHRTEICQFKILPTAFSEQTAKYSVRQYFCLYGILCSYHKFSKTSASLLRTTSPIANLFHQLKIGMCCDFMSLQILVAKQAFVSDQVRCRN